jgi:hypothetical protein
MLGPIAAWLMAKNLVGSSAFARDAAKVILGAAGVLLLALALGLALWLIRRDAVEEFQTERRAQETARALEGERRANQGGAERALAREAASKTTETRLETIHAEDPEAAVAPASRGSRAVADRLRDH